MDNLLRRVRLIDLLLFQPSLAHPHRMNLPLSRGLISDYDLGRSGEGTIDPHD